MGIRKSSRIVDEALEAVGGPHGSMPIPFALSASFWEEG